ncbi:DUF3566 domain-containing protein [Dermacoccaceae bacterium W4C1]
MSSTPEKGTEGRTAAPLPGRARSGSAATANPSASGDRKASNAGGAGAGNRPQRPQRAQQSRPAGRTAPRRVRLTVSRVDAWSVFKIAFLLSVAAAIAGVVMVAVGWAVLNGMGVFDAVQTMLTTLESEGTSFDLMDYIGFGRVVAFSVVIGVIDIILLTAIATLSAFLYNICASLVGGVQMTLSDE